MAKKKVEAAAQEEKKLEGMVLGHREFQALEEYILSKPYKEVAGLVPILQNATQL